MPRFGIGIIITPDAASSRAYDRDVLSERVTQQHLLERLATAADRRMLCLRSKAQRARTQTADRPRRDLEHDTPAAPSPPLDATLGVHGAMVQAEGGARRAQPSSTIRAVIAGGATDGIR